MVEDSRNSHKVVWTSLQPLTGAPSLNEVYSYGWPKTFAVPQTYLSYLIGVGLLEYNSLLVLINTAVVAVTNWRMQKLEIASFVCGSLLIEIFSWEPALWLANSQGAGVDDDDDKNI